MNRFSVRLYMDDIYHVYDYELEKTVFTGNLSDCDAFIRLSDRGYM